MKARTAKRHVREGLRSLKRNGWMTFASISAVAVTLMLVGVFLTVIMNVNHIGTTLEKDVEVRVLVDLTANKEQQATLKEEIKKLDHVTTVKFSSKDQELNNLIKSMGEDGKAFQLFEQQNPLNDTYIVKTDSPEQIAPVAKKIEGLKYIDEVIYGKKQVQKLFNAVSVGRNIGLVLIFGLLFTAMFLISNTIKITIMARRREIEIMRLVGATNNFIRWPFLLEGLLLGVLGSVIPIVLLLTGYKVIYNMLMPKLAGTMFTLLPFSPFVYQLSAILIGIGAVIGMWGSVMSIRKFLRK
ncbi:cell division protein FtsX [Bacillus sp. FJAT-25509]|uniref:permease-like cell division protein FtsX n=1 Tax=Bacillaceae TaxID=186817 RepID=UPI0006F4AC75|nr:permease-like cell division protein FtsX [Bacillus sp. FJAT-25509]KQL39986.1 cell division protein FtsX [Bacillus sp. FJAT-25509]